MIPQTELKQKSPPLEFIEAPRVYQPPRIRKIDPWHPLLWTDVRIWYEGRVETRVCSEVSANEAWGRFDGQLLPMECVISDDEWAIILEALKDV